MADRTRGILTYEKSPGHMAKDLRPAVAVGLGTAVETWHADYTARHFVAAAESRYGYKRRGYRYTHNKLRAYGHRLPLVESGESRRMIRAFVAIVKSPRQARAIMRAPGYFYKKASAKNPNQPDKVAELTATTQRELLELAQVNADAITAHLDTLTDKETRTLP